MSGGQPDEITQTTSKEPWGVVDWISRMMFGPRGNEGYPYSGQVQTGLEDLMSPQSLAALSERWNTSNVTPFNQTQLDTMNWIKQAVPTAITDVNMPVQQMLNSAMYSNYAPQAANTLQGYEALNSQTAGGKYVNPNSNPYLGSFVEASQRPLHSAYAKSLAQDVNTPAAMSGRVGSGFNVGLRDTADENYLKSLSDTAASIYAPAYQQERGLQQQAQQFGANLGSNLYQYEQNRALQAVPLSFQNIGNLYESLGKLGAIGDVEQKQSQAELADWMTTPEQKEWEWLWKTLVAPVTSTAAMTPWGGTTTQTGGSYGAGPLQQALGAGAGLAGTIGMIAQALKG